MAIVLDINFLCHKMIDTNTIVELLNDYAITIESINSIDDWMWNNEKKVELLNQVEGVLNNNRIVIIQLKNQLIKDLGIYIEKIESDYLYTLWINTEGYEVLDYDVITSENRKFYDKIYLIISKINKKVQDVFEVVGIGLETDFYYSENIISMIRNSRNIVVWILNGHIKDVNVSINYKEKKVEGLKMTVLEKIE